MKRIILAALGSALLLPSQAQQKNKEYTNSVSYTHLTLPTN